MSVLAGIFSVKPMPRLCIASQKKNEMFCSDISNGGEKYSSVKPEIFPGGRYETTRQAHVHLCKGMGRPVSI